MSSSSKGGGFRNVPPPTGGKDERAGVQRGGDLLRGPVAMRPVAGELDARARGDVAAAEARFHQRFAVATGPWLRS